MEFAYTLYVDGLCDVCGRPMFECRNEQNRGLYEALDATCYAQAAVEEHTGQKGFKPEPGQRFYAAEIDEGLVARLPLTAAGAPPLNKPVDEQPEADNRGDL